MNNPKHEQPHILVVDDVVDSAASLADLLKMWGFDAYAAYSGREAVDAAHWIHPDLVIMDIRMPIMSGVEAARQIRRDDRDHKTKFIAISAYWGELNENQAIQTEFEYQMVKPGDLDTLRQIIETECRHGH